MEIGSITPPLLHGTTRDKNHNRKASFFFPVLLVYLFTSECSGDFIVVFTNENRENGERGAKNVNLFAVVCEDLVKR